MFVSLAGTPAGHLAEDAQGRISFQFLPEYRNLLRPPVLSQSFVGGLHRTHRGERHELPPFFANLLPEGPLRELIERRLRIPPGDDLALLAAVGGDLPGAVEVAAGEGAAEEEPALRFSLSGVQWKFSVLREAGRVILPGPGQRGDWIVKLDSARYPRLAENEFAVLEWARGAGFDVPESHLQPLTSLPPALQAHAPAGTNVLALRRYDRDGQRRIHQEDFAQWAGVPPRLKYEKVSYERCARWVREVLGEAAYFEVVRRLVFMVVSGNMDAHLKNWSLTYPDGLNAALAPLYDQVCTVVWDDLPRTLALRFTGTKNLLRIDEESFAKLARKAQAGIEQTRAVVHEAMRRLVESWHAAEIGQLLPPGHAASLHRYWEESRLVKPWLKRFGSLRGHRR
ncbi:MAG TPA: HipA domain-containing protein [Thermoanaerobaculia bacterium]|nr:HipA domain-containing protein [Thermoanaerobaculia bacterium]